MRIYEVEYKNWIEERKKWKGGKRPYGFRPGVDIIQQMIPYPRQAGDKAIRLTRRDQQGRVWVQIGVTTGRFRAWLRRFGRKVK